MKILETGVKKVRNVGGFVIGREALLELKNLLEFRRSFGSGDVVYFIDMFFAGSETLISSMHARKKDLIIFVDTTEEPTTDMVDQFVTQIKSFFSSEPSAIVGIGGGSTMDVAKAAANLLTNGGLAEQYQGWDLLEHPAIYKIAVPTLSGTGAEATRTCVMTNKCSGLKLGMNSDFTVFDQVIMDPELTRTVPRNQYFYSGMDAYLHCMEALAGSYRNPVGDALSREAINLCKIVFLSSDMMSEENREILMVASYLGGCAIATTYVGLVHPLSAGLSVVLGLHHCVANCVVMRAMREFYPTQYELFWSMAEAQNIDIPEGLASNLSESQYDQLYESSIIHSKPLTNALGKDYKSILTKKTVTSLFRQM